MRNLYDVLGVPRDADQARIRKEFKSLARKYHPDLNKDDAKAAERFKEVSAAYEVLGDDQRRADYDEFGEASLRTGFDRARARQYRSMGGGFPGFGGGGGGGVGLDELFGSLFAQQGRSRPRGPGRGSDIEAELHVSIPDLVQGTAQVVDVRRPAACGSCGGRGGTSRQTCGGCRGSGRMSLGGGMALPCNQCGGDGVVFEQECIACGTTGRTMKSERLRIRVPPGTNDGQTIRLRGKGGVGQRGGPAGDLRLTLRLRPHPRLRRKGDQLEMDVPITILEAVAGGRIEVPTPDGGSVKLKVPPGSGGGRRLRLRGKGLPTGKDTRGDLMLVLRPVAPEGDDPELLRLVEALDAFYEDDPRASMEL